MRRGGSGEGVWGGGVELSFCWGVVVVVGLVEERKR